MTPRPCSHAVYVRHLGGWDADCGKPSTSVVVDSDDRPWPVCDDHRDWDPEA